MAAAAGLQLLRKAGTDEERIAALILVSRVVRAGDLSGTERREIYDAVGFSFVNRLLDSGEAGSDCPSHYQQLGLTLLACFATDPQLATHSEITSKVSLFLKLISNSSTPESVREDTQQLLLSLTATPRGLHLLASRGCLQEAARLLAQGDGSLRELLLQLLGQEVVVARHEEAVQETLGLLAAGFRERQDKVKFELSSVLCSVLESVGQVLIVSGAEPWVRDIAAGVFDILSSKITQEMRESALLVSANLCQMCGVQWTLTSGDTKLFRLLANITSLEMRLCVEGRGMEEVSRQSELVCCCCVILENSVTFSASQTSSYTKLTEEDLLQLHSAFSEAFKSLTDFLLSLPRPLSHHDPLTLATTRLLGAWLAEETLALSSELYRLLPRLLEMSGAHLQQSKGEGVLDNPLKFLLPGLSHLVAEEGARAAVKTCLPQLLLDFMTALYSSCMSDEAAVSLFALCLEVLLTVCVSEVSVRRDKVFCQLARLLSRIILSDIASMRLSMEALLLWLMIAREKGRECCEVDWGCLWQKIVDMLVATLSTIVAGQTSTTEDQSEPKLPTVVSPTEPLKELWHLAVREVMAICVGQPDVKQLLVDTHAVSLLAASIPDLSSSTTTGEEELEAVQRLSENLC